MKTILIVTVIGCLTLGLVAIAEATDSYNETLTGWGIMGGGSAMGWHGDDSSWYYSLPFTFPFYGTNYNSVYISSNGFINFTSSWADYSNTTSELISRVQIAPLWDDLRTDIEDSDIYIYQPASGSLCIRWDAVQYSTDERTEFEVVLYSNGDIKFNYGTTGSALTPTVGISKGDGSHYLLSTYNDRSSLNYVQTSYIRPQGLNQPPTADANANPTVGQAPLAVNFTGTGIDTDGTIVSYSWNFGDGGTSTQQNPTHTYANPGNYAARLTVTDDDGATNSDTVNINVQAPAPPPPTEIPRLMRFQGMLKDAGGAPLDGAYDLTFRLYEDELAGAPIWEEVQQNINIDDGLLDVELGSVTALELPFDRQYWLGVEVESDGEMVPRFKLTTVPYSFKAAQ